MKIAAGAFFIISALATSAYAATEPATVFFALEYAFDYASNPTAPDIVQSLCATRCNAISGNYKSYMMPGGWRLIKLESSKKLIVDIDNPFVKGNCICTGDVYSVTKEDPVPDTASP